MGQGYLSPQCEETVAELGTEPPQTETQSSNFDVASALGSTAGSETPVLDLAGESHDGPTDARPAWARDFDDIDVFDPGMASGTPTWTEVDGATTHKEAWDLADAQGTTSERTKTGDKGYTETRTTDDLLKGRRSSTTASKTEDGDTASLTTSRGMNKDGQLELGQVRKTGSTDGDRTADSSTMTMDTDSISGARARTDVVDGVETTRSQSATLGRDNAAFGRSGRQGLVQGDKDNGSTQYAALGGGLGVSVDFETADGRVIAVTKVYAELNAGIGGEAHGAGGTKDALKASVEIGVKASAKASYEFRHQLTPGEVNSHRDAVLSGEASFLSGLAELHGWSAESASELATGDSVKTTRTLGAEGALGLEVGTLELGGTLKGVGSSSWMAVAKAEGIAVTVQAGASISTGAEGRLQLGAIGIGGELDDKSTDFIRLVTDPLDMYDADDLVLYDALSAAHTRDDIEELWQIYGAECFQRTDGDAASRSLTGAVGIGPIDVGLTDASSLSSEVGYGKDGLDATFVGTHERESSLGPLSFAGDTNTLTATVADDEATMSFEAQTGWVAPGIPSFDSVKSLGLPKAMKDSFTNSRDRLTRFSLTDLELTQCMERAAHPTEWAACARTVTSHHFWVRTGEMIQAETGPPEWAQASSSTFARFVAQLRHLANFVSTAHDSEHVVFNLTRRFGSGVGDLHEVPGQADLSDRLEVLREDVSALEADKRGTGEVPQLQAIRQQLWLARSQAERIAVADARWAVWVASDLEELETRVDWIDGHATESCDSSCPSSRTIGTLKNLEQRALTRITEAATTSDAAILLSQSLPPIYAAWIRADRQAVAAGASSPQRPDFERIETMISSHHFGATWSRPRALFPEIYSHWGQPS
ncbi:MAG: hypothetical protein KC912_23215 [Proteobacteria bacterium]|nr:hypothetical protein [Pseudomonadota bacterium]